MTVAELIEKLKELPQDYTVTADAQNKDCDRYEITNVYLYDNELFQEVELS